MSVSSTDLDLDDASANLTGAWLEERRLGKLKWRRTEIVVRSFPPEALEFTRLAIRLELVDGRHQVTRVSPTQLEERVKESIKRSAGLDRFGIKFGSEHQTSTETSSRGLVTAGLRTHGVDWQLRRTQEFEILGDYELACEFLTTEAVPMAHMHVTATARPRNRILRAFGVVDTYHFSSRFGCAGELLLELSPR